MPLVRASFDADKEMLSLRSNSSGAYFQRRRAPQRFISYTWKL